MLYSVLAYVGIALTVCFYSSSLKLRPYREYRYM